MIFCEQDSEASYDINDMDGDPTPRYDNSDENKLVPEYEMYVRLAACLFKISMDYIILV